MDFSYCNFNSWWFLFSTINNYVKCFSYYRVLWLVNFYKVFLKNVSFEYLNDFLFYMSSFLSTQLAQIIHYFF